jgi:hypothetical protein
MFAHDMRSLFLTTFALLSALNLFAQENKQPDIKYWYEGPLTVDDFSVRKISQVGSYSDNMIASWLDYTISSASKRIKTGNLSYSRPVTLLYMDKLESWIDPAQFTSWTMRYQQTYFDIAECTRRELQAAFDTTANGYSDKWEYYKRLLSSRSETYFQETAYGRDTTMVAYYEALYKDKLDGLGEIPAAEVEASGAGTGLGWFIGYSSEIYTGGMRDWLGAGHKFAFGFDLWRNNAFMSLVFGLGGAGKLRKDGFYYDDHMNYHWNTEKNNGAYNIDLDFGYRVYDAPYLGIAPFAGVGLGGFDQNTDMEKDKSSSLFGLRLALGANFDVKLRRSLDTNSTYSESILRFQVYGAWTDCAPGAYYSINAGVVLDWVGWLNSKVSLRRR